MPTIAEKLFAKVGPPSPNSKAGLIFRRDGVRDTSELKRIAALPRRRWQDGLGGRHGTPEEMARLLTAAFKREGGEQEFRPVQAAALSDLHDFGLFGPMRVGSGKTLVSFAAPAVLGSQRPLLLIPAKLRDKTLREWQKAQQHWVLPPIRIESYEMLGRVQAADYLEQYRPDLIIADEAHRLKNPKAAVTKRVRRWMSEHGHETRFVPLSGTMTTRSIKEYYHLLRWALGERLMPLPIDWPEMQEWAECLDVGEDSRAPGALRTLCNGEELSRIESGGEDAISAIREAYARRLTETPGVISTVDKLVSCSLSISQVDLPLDHLAPYFEQLRGGETPDGHPWTEKVDEWRHARELTTGFYYVWSPRPPDPWLFARRAWAKFVRETLKHSRLYDSEMQVAQAVAGGKLSSIVHDPIDGPKDVYAMWVATRDTFKPNQEPRWVSDTVLNYAAKWLETPGICWVEHVAFGERLSEMTGLPYFGGGGVTKDGRNIEDESECGPIIASIAANSDGRNLQRFSRNLVVSCPPNNKTWEQMAGRTHRDGQTADEVTFDVILGCREALEGFWKAVTQAGYVSSSTQQPQKLLYADKTVMEEGSGIGPLWV